MFTFGRGFTVTLMVRVAVHKVLLTVTEYAVVWVGKARGFGMLVPLRVAPGDQA
jgi:hypothetical protein